MYFGIWFIDEIGEAIYEGLRALLMSLCEAIYSLIMLAFKLFMVIGEANILDNDIVVGIYQRVGLILGIFMLFKLTFSFIQMLVSPDQLTDKEKGAGKIIMKVVVVIVLLAMTPSLFNEAYKLQHAVVKQQVIGRVILGNTELNMNNFSSLFSYYVFSNFYKYSGTPDDDGNCTEDFYDKEFKNSILDDGSFALAGKCLNVKTGDDNGYVTIFDGWTAIAVGIFVLYVIVVYVVTLGMRVAKLAFLQLIAPIPILSYISPQKETAFNKWVKQCISTFLDLFIRMAIIYFAMLMLYLLIDSDVNGALISSTGLSQTDPLLGWVKLIIVLGVLLFAKKAPELISDMFPGFGGKGGLDFGLGLKSRTDIAGKGLIKRAASVAATAPVMAGQRAIQNFNRKKLDKQTGELKNRNGLIRVGDALIGAASGTARGLYYGARDEKILGGVKAGVSSQNKSSEKTNAWVASGGTSFVGRATTNVASKLGVATRHDKNQATIGHYEEEQKRHKGVADVTNKVRTDSDSVMDRAKSKINVNENLLGSDGLNIMVKATGMTQAELSKIGITSNTSIGDASSLSKLASDRLKEQLKVLDDTEINKAAFTKVSSIKDEKGNNIEYFDQAGYDAEVKKLENEKQSLLAAISKLDKQDKITKSLSEFAVSENILGNGKADPVIQSNIDNVLNSARISINNLKSNNREKEADTVEVLLNALEEARSTGVVPSIINPTDGKTIDTAFGILDAISTYCGNISTEENRTIASIEEDKRAFQSQEKVVAAKANYDASKK